MPPGRVPLLEHVPDDLVRARRELGPRRDRVSTPDCPTRRNLRRSGARSASTARWSTSSGTGTPSATSTTSTPRTQDDVRRPCARTRLEAARRAGRAAHHPGTALRARCWGRFARWRWSRATRRSCLVLVVLMPLERHADGDGNDAAAARRDRRLLRALARTTLPDTPVMLGCARPLGRAQARHRPAGGRRGLNGIAYPADGIVAYAEEERGLEPQLRQRLLRSELVKRTYSQRSTRRRERISPDWVRHQHGRGDRARPEAGPDHARLRTAAASTCSRTTPRAATPTAATAVLARERPGERRRTTPSSAWRGRLFPHRSRWRSRIAEKDAELPQGVGRVCVARGPGRARPSTDLVEITRRVRRAASRGADLRAGQRTDARPRSVWS